MRGRVGPPPLDLSAGYGVVEGVAGRLLEPGATASVERLLAELCHKRTGPSACAMLSEPKASVVGFWSHR